MEANARAAGFQLLIDFRLGQFGQDALHVVPGIRIGLQLQGQRPRGVEVAGADVVGGQCQPGAVGFGDVFRQLFLEQVQVARPGQDALAGIEAIGDLQPVGGFLGQHHDAAHIGVAGRIRVPVRLVVGDGGDQSPVKAGQRLRRLEILAELGQRGLDLAQKLDDVGLLQAPHMAEVAVFQPGQRAVVLDAFDEAVQPRLEFGVRVRTKQPDDRRRFAQGQGGAQVGNVLVGDVLDALVDGDIVDLAVAELFQQIEHIALGDFDNLHSGQLLLEFFQRHGLPRSGHYVDRLAGQLRQLGQR